MQPIRWICREAGPSATTSMPGSTAADVAGESPRERVVGAAC